MHRHLAVGVCHGDLGHLQLYVGAGFPTISDVSLRIVKSSNGCSTDFSSQNLSLEQFRDDTRVFRSIGRAVLGESGLCQFKPPVNLHVLHVLRHDLLSSLLRRYLLKLQTCSRTILLLKLYLYVLVHVHAPPRLYVPGLIIRKT